MAHHLSVVRSVEDACEDWFSTDIDHIDTISLDIFESFFWDGETGDVPRWVTPKVVNYPRFANLDVVHLARNQPDWHVVHGAPPGFLTAAGRARRAQAIVWLVENLHGPWYVLQGFGADCGGLFRFKELSDAIYFKLRWWG